METVKINIYKTNYKAEIPKEMFDDVSVKHPNKEIQVHFNTDFQLDELGDNESVCWGDGETFIFILKPL